MSFDNKIILDETANIRPSRKKPMFEIGTKLRHYLRKYGREYKLPINYNDLRKFSFSVPIKDKEGNPTHWERTLYDSRELEYLREGLVEIYAILKTKGDFRFTNHLDVARIEYCPFGNSQPFRIKIINRHNDNQDHYYIKIADSSRVYGLELEHLLSPNRISYFIDDNTLVEEHIPGIPGDIFLQNYLNDPNTNKVRLAKEFVRFNERCFLRLLGDMRSYNFVVHIIPDIEGYQYRIRAIDFDQQSYEGRKKMYLPQFFKENYAFVDICLKYLNSASIEQYQAEERTLVTFRLASARYRMKELLDIMAKDHISFPEKIHELTEELNEHFHTNDFAKCKSMGDVVKRQLKQTLQKNLLLVEKNIGKGKGTD